MAITTLTFILILQFLEKKHSKRHTKYHLRNKIPHNHKAEQDSYSSNKKTVLYMAIPSHYIF